MCGAGRVWTTNTSERDSRKLPPTPSNPIFPSLTPLEAWGPFSAVNSDVFP